MIRVFIASDHGGFEAKQKLIADLSQKDYLEIIDLGPGALDPEDDYPPFAFKVAESVAAAEMEPETVGILICRGGNGMAIAANKVKGVRAAVCFSAVHAQESREDNHANILVLEADFGGDPHLAIFNAFMNTEWGQDRHERRVGQITAYEESHIKG